MTEAEINNLRELLKSATPGPWEIEDKLQHRLVSNGEVWVEAVVAHNYQEGMDAALIVAAVNALPGLLDEVERLRADAARYRWLRDHDVTMHPNDPFVVRTTLAGHGSLIPMLVGDEMDAAIDAAMEEQQQ